jgi:hypothetical protein
MTQITALCHLQLHTRIDALVAGLDELRIEQSSVSAPTRKAVKAAINDLRTEMEAASAAIAMRVNALEQDALTSSSSGTKTEGKGRGAGLWKLLEASMREQEAQVLERVASRCDAVDAGIKRCVATSLREADEKWRRCPACAPPFLCERTQSVFRALVSIAESTLSNANSSRSSTPVGTTTNPFSVHI